MLKFYKNAILNACSWEQLGRVWSAACKCKHVELLDICGTMSDKINMMEVWDG